MKPSEQNYIDKVVEESNMEYLRQQHRFVDFTKSFFDKIRMQIESGKNVIISVFAETGSGKSYSLISIYEFIEKLRGRSWSSGNIRFDWFDALDYVMKMPPVNTMVVDEQTEPVGQASYYVQTRFKNIEETVRARQINLLFSSPTLRAHVHHYILQVFKSEQISFKVLDYKEQKHKVGTKGYNYCMVWKPDPKLPFGLGIFLGYIKLPCPENTDELVKYTKRKIDFIDDMRKGKQGSFKGTISKYVDQIIRLDDLKFCTGKGQLKTVVDDYLSEAGALTRELRDNVVNKIDMEMRRRGITYAPKPSRKTLNTPEKQIINQVRSSKKHKHAGNFK